MLVLQKVAVVVVGKDHREALFLRLVCAASTASDSAYPYFVVLAPTVVRRFGNTL